jgi:hypothetical protein
MIGGKEWVFYGKTHENWYAFYSVESNTFRVLFLEEAVRKGKRIDGNISTTTSHRKEAPCPGCSRMNDIGVHSCWCCGGKL